jgi:N-glycosylase/DNA lyase
MEFFGAVIALFMAIRGIIAVIKNLRSNPRRKLRLIDQAVRDTSMTIAKLSSYTLTGSLEYYYENFEYVYKVDEQLYYLTYRVNRKFIDSEPRKKRFADSKLRRFFKQDAINESQLLQLGNTLVVFYDKRKPQKVASKQEIFVNTDGLRRVRTKTNNPHRDISATWINPVDLRTSGK